MWMALLLTKMLQSGKVSSPSTGQGVRAVTKAEKRWQAHLVRAEQRMVENIDNTIQGVGSWLKQHDPQSSPKEGASKASDLETALQSAILRNQRPEYQIRKAQLLLLLAIARLDLRSLQDARMLLFHLINTVSPGTHLYVSARKTLRELERIEQTINTRTSKKGDKP